jgi:hypothetical protein
LAFWRRLRPAGLLAICIVATCSEARERVDAYQPINRADRVADYLYLPEIVYFLPLLIMICHGPGRWSLDYLIFH